MAGSYPGLIYPGQAYPGVTTTGHLFTPPTVLRPLTENRLEYRPFNRVKGKVGLSVLKTGTSYATVENPTDEQVTAADAAYLGGRTYTINDTEAAALTAAGYEVTAL